MARRQLCSGVLSLATVVVALAAAPDYVHKSGPTMLSYAELVTLSDQDEIPAELQPKLTALLTTPFVSNEAFYRKAAPHRPVHAGIGPGLRVVQ